MPGGLAVCSGDNIFVVQASVISWWTPGDYQFGTDPIGAQLALPTLLADVKHFPLLGLSFRRPP